MNFKKNLLFTKIKIKLIFLTCLTLIAFAANSIFCRLALSDSKNDPISFTIIRLASGALILFFYFVIHMKSDPIVWGKKAVLAPLMLFAYALFFSLSYVQIGAGMGALILFLSAQLTMMVATVVSGYKISLKESIGFLIAISGFIYLLLPGIYVPPFISALFMMIAGVSWGLYTLIGKNNNNPVLATARNFIFTIPILILILLFHHFHLTDQGLLLAVLSGGLTSGIGYVLWYVVLKDIQASTAAILQLCVPSLATLGGILFLDEKLNSRLIISSLLIFFGIFLKMSTTEYFENWFRFLKKKYIIK